MKDQGNQNKNTVGFFSFLFFFLLLKECFQCIPVFPTDCIISLSVSVIEFTNYQ